MSKLLKFLFKRGRISADTIKKEGLVTDNNSHRATSYHAKGKVKIKVEDQYFGDHKSKGDYSRPLPGSDYEVDSARITSRNPAKIRKNGKRSEMIVKNNVKVESPYSSSGKKKRRQKR